MHASIAAEWDTLLQNVQSLNRGKTTYIRAAWTEVPGEKLEPNHESGGEDNVPSPQENEYEHDSDVEEIEVNVYDNDYYLRSTDKEHMAWWDEVKHSI